MEMMMTDTEITSRTLANRANGKLSHGPRTPEGKAVSSMNAVKHGFFARDPLLAGESAEEFADSSFIAACGNCGRCKTKKDKTNPMRPQLPPMQ